MESITGGNTPKYQELTEQLRLQIVSGEIAPGQKLPSENTLSAQYQVSRQTVRKALAILQNEGYIYAEHGRGTFCSEMMRHAHPSKNIAVVTTYLSDYIFPRVIQGIDDVLTGAGYSIVLKNTKNSRTREAECLQEILSKDIDGVIIEPSKSQIFCRHMNLYEQLEKSHIPYVFIQGCFPQMKDKPHVLLLDWKGQQGIFPNHYVVVVGFRKDNGYKKLIVNPGWGYNFHVVDMEDDSVKPVRLYWVDSIEKDPDGAADGHTIGPKDSYTWVKKDGKDLLDPDPYSASSDNKVDWRAADLCEELITGTMIRRNSWFD